MMSIIILSTINSFGQGMNNENNSLDEIDIKNALTILGLEVFKFPVAPGKSKSYIKIHAEEYEDNKLIDKGELTSDFTDSELFINDREWSLMIDDTTGRTVRLYLFNDTDSSFGITINIGDITVSARINYDASKYGLSQSRAFEYKQPEAGRKIPIFVRYMLPIDQPMIHCPGGAPVSWIARQYSHIFVVYLELSDK